MAKKAQAINRPITSYQPGAKVFCWRFCHPRFGWVGGGDTDDWDTNSSVIESRMRHCEWPSELIARVA